MDRSALQLRLLDAEAYWFGSVRDMPQVFVAGERWAADPHLATRTSGRRTPPVEGREPDFDVKLDTASGGVSFSRRQG